MAPEALALPAQFATGAGVMPEFGTLSFSEGWKSLEQDPTRAQFEKRALPAYLSKRRWFASKATQVVRAELKSSFVLAGRGGDWLLAVFRAHLSDGRSEDYFVPLAVAWDSQTGDSSSVDPCEIIALVHKGNQSGTLINALADPRFVADLVRAAGEQKTLTASSGTLQFSPTHAYFPLQEEDERNIRKLGAEQSNSSVLIARKMVLKAYRKLEHGIQPELEMGRYLTDVARYPNTPPLLASVEQRDNEGEPTALAVIQGFIPNQGDGWSYTLNHLRGIFEGILEGKSEGSGSGAYTTLAERLGTRVAELHQAFALGSGDAAFQPEPIETADVAAWKQQMQSEAESTFGLLAGSESVLPPEQHVRVQALLQQQNRILSFITGFELKAASSITKTRFHGDLHLGQVLVSGDDFYIIDFEGEPARPFAQRRANHSPLKDVAGMLRSLNYAAWSALFEAGAGEPANLAVLEKPARDWEHQSSSAFMRGYQKAIQGCSSCPADAETFQQMLSLFILEKALYEVRYELANRPTWLRIPVEGILNLMAHQSGQP